MIPPIDMNEELGQQYDQIKNIVQEKNVFQTNRGQTGTDPQLALQSRIDERPD